MSKIGLTVMIVSIYRNNVKKCTKVDEKIKMPMCSLEKYHLKINEINTIIIIE